MLVAAALRLRRVTSSRSHRSSSAIFGWIARNPGAPTKTRQPTAVPRPTHAMDSGCGQNASHPTPAQHVVARRQAGGNAHAVDDLEVRYLDRQPVPTVKLSYKTCSEMMVRVMLSTGLVRHRRVPVAHVAAHLLVCAVRLEDGRAWPRGVTGSFSCPLFVSCGESLMKYTGEEGMKGPERMVRLKSCNSPVYFSGRITDEMYRGGRREGR